MPCVGPGPSRASQEYPHGLPRSSILLPWPKMPRNSDVRRPAAPSAPHLHNRGYSYEAHRSVRGSRSLVAELCGGAGSLFRGVFGHCSGSLRKGVATYLVTALNRRHDLIGTMDSEPLAGCRPRVASLKPGRIHRTAEKRHLETVAGAFCMRARSKVGFLGHLWTGE